MKRVAKWTGWSFLVLFILGIIAWTIANAVGSSRLERELAAVKESGLATHITQMAPAKPAPGENAAPLWLAAFALLEESGEFPECYLRGSKMDFSQHTADEKKELRAWLEKNADVFSLATRARDRKVCHIERQYADGFTLLLPDVAKSIRLGKILQLRAFSLADEGKPEAARDAIRDLLALADAYKDEPVLVCQLVRVVVAQLALDAIDRCITAETSEADLKAWLDVLPDPKRYDGMMERGFRGELAVIAGLLSQSMSQLWDQLAHVTHPMNEDPELLRPLAGNLLLPVLKSDGARYLALMRRAIEIAQKPYLEARPPMAALSAEVEDDSSVWHPVTRILMPALFRCLDNHAHLIAKISVLRAGLEAELERAAKGRYPEKIGTLDPFTGKPLFYGEGRIESVGPEGRLDKPMWKLRHK